MKILFVQGSMDAGGISKVNDTLANEFIKQKHEVSFLSYVASPSLEANEQSLNFNKFGLLQLFISIIKLLVFFVKSDRYDLVISSSDLVSLPVCLVKPFFNFKLIVNSHTNVIEHLKEASFFKKILYKLCGWSYTFSDVIANVSEGAAKASEQYFNLAKVIELQNPVEKWELNQASYPHKWFSDYSVLVACGRLTKSKNYELMLKAFSQVLKKTPDLKLIILGDGEEKENLINLSINLNIDCSVSFEGNVPEPRLYMEYAICLLHTSYYEGSPLVLIEALSVGTPVVTTDFNSGARETLIDGKYGVISKSFSVGDLVNAIESCLRSEPNARSFYIDRADDFLPSVCCMHYLNCLGYNDAI